MFGDDAPPDSDGCDVSVIIPAFNAEAFLKGSVHSVQGQFCTPREIIIVDDASTDRTTELARRLASEDGRIRVLSLDRNGGPSTARNTGLAAAKGTWITFLDADDSYDPRRLGTLWQIARTSQHDVITDNLELFGDVDATSPMFPVNGDGARALAFSEFLRGCLYGRTASGRRSFAFLKPMVRRGFIEENGLRYDEDLRVGEDLIFYVHCFLAGARWTHTMSPLYRYRVRSGSLVEAWSPDVSARIGSRLEASLEDPRLAADPEAGRALSRLRGLVRRDEIYGLFRQAVLAGKSRQAGRVLTRDPRASYLLFKELLLRSPRIVGRLLLDQAR